MSGKLTSNLVNRPPATVLGWLQADDRNEVMGLEQQELTCLPPNLQHARDRTDGECMSKG